ncbi:MAG: hypothetical protein V2I27_15700 [Erythrobacter sp.]|jgi:hypothetical protein|nr:hypothetical protein [Erythrobacter sp.]
MLQAQTILDRALSEFSTEIGELAETLISVSRGNFPGANILVYDGYNALAVGFSANEKQSGIAFSITAYPRWVSLFFPRGKELDDPQGLLKGSGKAIRHIVIEDEHHFASPCVRGFIEQAVARCDPPFPEGGGAGIIVKSVASKKRARRPD